MKLPAEPIVPADRQRALAQVTEYHAHHPDLPLAELVLRELGVDLSTHFAGQRIPHPFGKASGQLSCTLRQVAEDLSAGLGFIVLKTVIAESEDASRSMEAWAERETKMTVERILAEDGTPGWTVTWKGRGWHGTLDSYLEFCRGAFSLAEGSGTPVIPSVKYHLPALGQEFNQAEYQHTTTQLATAWGKRAMPLTIEKDFSPTLAGDGRAGNRENIVRWLREVPQLIRTHSPRDVRVGLKLMNAIFDDAFQREMLSEATSGTGRPDYVVVFNRLFDAQKKVAYGGFDLNARNLGVLAGLGGVGLPMSGTGNIVSGRIMLEYALMGCENGQAHTVFQLPRSEYLPGEGGRSVQALRTLILHPLHGLVAWLWSCRDMGIVNSVKGSVRFADVVGKGLKGAD